MWEKIKDWAQRPNFLTIFRALAAPGIILLLYFPNRFTCFAAALLFSAAAITDYLDGYLARQRGMTSKFGKVMDPIADKILVSSTMIMLVARNWIPAWVVCVILAREFLISGIRSMVSDEKQDISASSLGKYKTGFQIAALIPLLLHYDYFGLKIHVIGMFFLWCALIMTIWSGIDYVSRYRDSIEI